MEFINLKKQFKKIKPNVEKRIFSILDKTNFILGEEVQELENKLSKFSNIKHSITCANGTDAIILSMMALGVKKGDVVFVHHLHMQQRQRLLFYLVLHHFL